MRKVIEYSRKLEEAGLTRQQAEVHLNILEEVIEGEMATKVDILALDTKIQIVENKLTSKIEELDHRLSSRIEELDNRLTAKIEELDTKMTNGFKELEYKLTIRLGMMLTVAVSALGVMIKLG